MDIGVETDPIIIEPISEPVPGKEAPPAPSEPEIEEETYERDEELVPA